MSHQGDTLHAISLQKTKSANTLHSVKQNNGCVVSVLQYVDIITL